MDKFNQNILIFGTLGILLGFFVCMVIGSNNIENFVFQKDYTPEQIPNSENEIVDNCKNLDLVESTYCLRDNVETFYFYNATKESYSDIPTLQKNNGDCLNYAKLYSRLADKLEFDTKLVYVEESGEKVHVLPLISDNEGYCIIDDLKINCGVY